MFFNLIVLLAILSVAFGGASDSASVSASVKDTNVNGIEGLNVNIAAPFKFQDYVVGFKYAVGDLARAPESVFAKRTFEADDGSNVSVDGSYNLADKILSVAARWSSDKMSMSLGADADSKDKLTSVSFSKDTNIKDNKLTIRGAYDLLKKKISGDGTLDVDNGSLNVAYDTEDQDPVLSVNRAINANNEFSPSVSLKSGDVTYGYTRKWDGGSLASKLFPGDRVELEWTDKGSGGSWSTTANVPLDNKANTKVSFSRDWDY
jgi:hypothetical protein